jgi:hypothetical protein
MASLPSPLAARSLSGFPLLSRQPGRPQLRSPFVQRSLLRFGLSPGLIRDCPASRVSGVR